MAQCKNSAAELRHMACHSEMRQPLALGLALIPNHEPVSTAKGSLMMITEHIRIRGL